MQDVGHGVLAAHRPELLEALLFLLRFLLPALGAAVSGREHAPEALLQWAHHLVAQQAEVRLQVNVGRLIGLLSLGCGRGDEVARQVGQQVAQQLLLRRICTIQNL